MKIAIALLCLFFPGCVWTTRQNMEWRMNAMYSIGYIEALAGVQPKKYPRAHLKWNFWQGWHLVFVENEK